MQIIRNKRQSSTGGAANAQQKNKYRKRSVSVYLVFFLRAAPTPCAAPCVTSEEE